MPKKKPKTIPRINGNFAILDVKTGRKWLAKYFEKKRPAKASEGIGWRPVNKPLKVKIEGTIEDIYGSDDGISREFEIKVTKITVKP